METLSRYLLTFLLNSLWQIAVVTAIAALVCWLMRNSPAAHRHAVWVGALLASVALPLASVRTGQQTTHWQAPPVSYTQSAAPNPIPAQLRLGPELPAPPANSRTVPFGRTTAAILIGAYLLFLLFRIAKLGWAWIRTIQIQNAAQRPSVPALVESVWSKCLRAFGLTGVELLFSQNVSGPLMAGAKRSTIILPETMLAETEDVLTTAIGHEMAHIARHDFAFKIFYELLCLPVSFHPAAWVIQRGIERTREMACDELVTRQLMDPLVYARSMLSIAARMTASFSPGPALGVFDGDILEERIRRLVARPAAKLKRARLLLATGLSALAVCAIVASSLSFTARAQSGSQSEMKLAGEAYNQHDFEGAIRHFENAVKLDPANVNAKLFLAHALLHESLMSRARGQYLGVLAFDPKNKVAIEGLIVVAMDAKRFDEAYGWALKLVQFDPKHPGTYYTAGMLDWAAVYPEYVRAKKAAGGKVEEYSIPDPDLRKKLRDEFMPRVDDGFKMLEIALQLDPNYADAMAYTNLLCRLKAGMLDSPAEAAGMISKADEWVHRALAAKRGNGPAEPPPTQLNVDGPPPGPANSRMALAPPPPPPPPPPTWAASGNQSASSSPAPGRRNTVEVPGTFWQVAGQDDMPANTMVRLLKEKGFNSIRLATSNDKQLRVMVGPYQDAQSLEQAKAALETAGRHPLRTW